MIIGKKSVLRFVLAILIFIFAIVFSFTVNGYTLGAEILKILGLSSWSSENMGTHYTLFYSTAMMIIAYIIFPKSGFRKY